MEEQTIKFLNKAFMLAAVLVVGILVFFVGEMIFQNKSIDQQNQNQITVSGEGKVYVKPDVAIVSLGVTTQAKTVAEVTKSNTDKMNAVIDAVKALKVEEKDIQTTNYSLTPVYDYVVPSEVSIMYPSASSTMIRSNTVSGYKLEQDIQVKIRDFTKIGDILSKATASGSNQIGNLQFTIDNPEQYKEQARAQAIAKAKSNAQNLSKESGIGLGKLINVYENYNSIYSSAKGAGVVSMDSAVPAVPTIQPGQQEIDVTINLTYRVR